MTKEASRVFRFSGFVILSSFNTRLPRRSPAKADAWSFSGRIRAAQNKVWSGNSTRCSRVGFTILELLVVITIIIVLAGLILATVGYVQKKGARSRAEAEIAAMSAALESYKADNGIYPRTSASDSLDARTSYNATGNRAASAELYAQLIGDSDYDGVTDSGARNYFSFNNNMKTQPNPA